MNDNAALVPRWQLEYELAEAQRKIVKLKAEVIRLRALVLAERDACAQVCDSIEDDYYRREGLKYAELKNDAETGARDCAAAIRARSEQ